MTCANCQADGPTAYTLRAHIDHDETGDGADAESDGDGQPARTDGGEATTVDLRFCSLECLNAWT